jgi:DNA-binding NarL/FixJ family response regulator
MKLSMRESQILDLLQRGMTNKEIGQELRLSPYTVRDQISAMLVRYDLNGRAALTAFHTKKTFAREVGLSDRRANRGGCAVGS